MTSAIPFTLGRNVNHDPRSRNFPAQPTATSVKTVLHQTAAPVLNQGQVGSCVGNAVAQCLNTMSFTRARFAAYVAGVLHRPYLNEDDALSLYIAATTIGGGPAYPPNDAGSDGLSGCKAAVQAGYLTAYRHAFSFDEFLLALQDQPVIVGTNWYESMFAPNTSSGMVEVSGNMVGGHEYLVLGADIERQFVTLRNSWGPGWGRAGKFGLTFIDFQRLLGEQGDVTVPIGISVAA